MELSHRYWIESKLLDPAPVIILQQKTTFITPLFKPYSLEKIHLTLLHFGILSKLYEEIKRYNDTLQLEEYMQAVNETLEKIKPQLPQTNTLRAKQFILLGHPKHPLLCIEFQKTEELLTIRLPLEKALHEFLTLCGVKKEQIPEAIKKSENLKRNTNEEYLAHLTLGHYPTNTALPNIQIANQPFTFVESHVAHREDH
jgi:hypothetical protein